MSKVYTSFEQVNRAYNKVRNELIEFRVLWDRSKLDEVGLTYLTVAPIAALAGYMGLYDPETKEIEFPSVYLPIASLWKDLGTKANALDVIRHEFGHALADLYPGALKKDGTFREMPRSTLRWLGETSSSVSFKKNNAMDISVALSVAMCPAMALLYGRMKHPTWYSTNSSTMYFRRGLESIPIRGKPLTRNGHTVSTRELLRI